MENKKQNLSYINLVPPFWLKCPKIGQPIRVPTRPNIFLIPMKTPLPYSMQQMFYLDDRWSIETAVVEATKMLGEKRQNIVFISIELSPYGDLMSAAECNIASVSHVYNPIGENSEDDLNLFIKKIAELPSPGYTHAVLCSCNDGYNKVGYAIAGLFMKMMKYTCCAATFLFSKKRPPGIYSQQIIDNLNKIYPSDPPSIKADFPSFIGYLGENNSDLTIQPPIAIDDSPNFLFDGGFYVTDKKVNSDLTAIISAAVPNGLFVTYNDGQVLPHLFLNDNPYNYLVEKYKDKLKKFKITFLPRGTVIYFVINSSNDGFYISTGINNFYFFNASINPELPRPIVCTGVYSSQDSQPIIFLTDVFEYGELYMVERDPQDRLKCLWNLILPNVEIVANLQSGKQSLKLGYRPCTTMKYITPLLNDFKMMNTFDGIPCDGVSLIGITYKAGTSFTVFIKPSLVLFFVVNSPKWAILYAKSEEEPFALVPFTEFSFESTPALAALNRKTVRFELIKSKQAISFCPVAICTNAIIDFYSRAKCIVDAFGRNPDSGIDTLLKLKPLV